MTDLDDDDLLAEITEALPEPKNSLQKLIQAVEFLERLRIKNGQPFDIPADLYEGDDDQFEEVFGDYLTHNEVSGFGRLLMGELVQYLSPAALKTVVNEPVEPWELDDREQRLLDAAIALRKGPRKLDLIGLGYELEKNESIGWAVSRRKEATGTTGKRDLSRVGNKLKGALLRRNLPPEIAKRYYGYVEMLFPRVKNLIDRINAARQT